MQATSSTLRLMQAIDRYSRDWPVLGALSAARERDSCTAHRDAGAARALTVPLLRNCSTWVKSAKHSISRCTASEPSLSVT